ncbi:hypothetical protein FACS1894185_2320 [Betaproteobacteria bacterium]|nr:hypothetical protein FACS1894185_2320 [Betaproteobacteria bacterium]
MHDMNKNRLTHPPRHCEEQSDAAILPTMGDCRVATLLAMTARRGKRAMLKERAA